MMKYQLFVVVCMVVNLYGLPNRMTMDEVVKTICAGNPNNETITFCQHLLPPRPPTRPPPKPKTTRPSETATGDYPSDYGANEPNGGDDIGPLEQSTVPSMIFYAQKQVLEQQNGAFGPVDNANINNNQPIWAPNEQLRFEPITSFPSFDQPTTTIATDVGTQQEDSVSQYCRQFAQHFSIYCRPDKSSLSEDGVNFCNAYSFSCNKQPEETAPSTDDYCRKFRDNFDYYCEDPIKFGKEAIVYCPYFSELCGVSVRERTQPPSFGGIESSGGKMPSSAQIRAECAKNRQLAQQFCFGKIQLQGTVRTKCDLYKRFCLRQPTTPATNFQ